MAEVKDAKREFSRYLEVTFLTGKNNGSKTIGREKGAHIVRFLKGDGCNGDPKLKFWIKQRQFTLLDYPALGLTDVLCVYLLRRR